MAWNKDSQSHYKVITSLCVNIYIIANLNQLYYMSVIAEMQLSTGAWTQNVD